MSTSLVSKDPLARLAERLSAISPETERAMQASIAGTVHRLGGNKLRHVLHGDWLHEPLHVVLTDVPIGAWTATVAFDAIASLSGDSSTTKSMNKAADATLVLGLIGAMGAAVTGLNDWSEIQKPAARKIGLVHGALNIVATALFAGSFIARAQSNRATGRSLAALGYLFVSVSAHLGGNLVYEHGIGVTAGQKADDVTGSMHQA